MSDKRENIKTFNADSIILMLILVFGLILYHNSNNNFAEKNSDSVATELSINQISGTTCDGLRLQLQKLFISDKDIVKFLSSIKNNQIIDSKKADQMIDLLQTIINKTEKIKPSFCLYHLFPAETDDVPILS